MQAGSSLLAVRIPVNALQMEGENNLLLFNSFVKRRVCVLLAVSLRVTGTGGHILGSQAYIHIQRSGSFHLQAYHCQISAPKTEELSTQASCYDQLNIISCTGSEGELSQAVSGLESLTKSARLHEAGSPMAAKKSILLSRFACKHKVRISKVSQLMSLL